MKNKIFEIICPDGNVIKFLTESHPHIIKYKKRGFDIREVKNFEQA